MGLGLQLKLLINHLKLCDTCLQFLDFNGVSLKFLLVVALQLIEVCVVHLAHLCQRVADSWVQA
jgi:hypothetical protein